MVYPHIEYHGPAYPDLGHASVPAGPRELDSRVSDGIHIRLLWHAADGHLFVAVHDDKTGEAFELTIGPGDSARDVYHHPYAYAAAGHGRRSRSGPPAEVGSRVGAAV